MEKLHNMPVTVYIFPQLTPVISQNMNNLRFQIIHLILLCDLDEVHES